MQRTSSELRVKGEGGREKECVIMVDVVDYSQSRMVKRVRKKEWEKVGQRERNGLMNIINI